jgi:ParB/RepB/Spo0J family partition protein
MWRMTPSRSTRYAAAVPTTRRRSSSLVRSLPAAQVSLAGEHHRLSLALIDIPPARIRRELGPIEDLAYSVSSIGLLHPVLVYRVRGRYRLIAGERRLQAARLLGWTEIDAMVREPSDNHLLLELIENTQRKWLTDAEEADALIRLVREMGREAKEVAAQSGRSEAYVSKRIRLFEDACLRQAVEQEQLSVSVAEEFLALPADERPALVAAAIEGGWDGRRARDAVRAHLEPALTASTEPMSDRSAASGSAPAQVERALDETDTSDRHPRATPAGPNGRPNNLAQQVRALNAVLAEVRAVELTPTDEKALAQLLRTLLRLARAYATGAGRSGIVFPSLEEAMRKARRGG